MNAVRARDEAADLFLRNERLCAYVVRRFSLPPFIEREDALSECRVGLWKACLTYDPNRGASFASYAIPVMRHDLIRFLNKAGYESRARVLRDLRRFPDVLAQAALDEALVRHVVQGLAIAPLVLQGLSQSEVARRAHLSRRTVGRQIQREVARIAL